MWKYSKNIISLGKKNKYFLQTMFCDHICIYENTYGTDFRDEQ